MSKVQRIIFIAVPSVLLPIVFFYDVIHNAVKFDITGADTLRELFVLISFATIYLIYSSSNYSKELQLGKSAGKILVRLVLILFVLGIITLIFGSKLTTPLSDDRGERTVSAFFFFLALLMGLVTGLFAISSFISIRNYVFYKRRKGTVRNFLIFSLIVILCVILGMKPLDMNNSIIAKICFVAAIVMISIISFRQNWIVYLSRKEKKVTLIYSALLVISFTLFGSFIDSKSFINAAVTTVSGSLQQFVLINCIFGAIYFGMAFVSTLFHLPTAEVYERKQSELSSLHNISRLVSQVLDFKELTDTVTTMALEVCGARSAWLEVATGEIGKPGFEIKIVSKKNISDADINAIESLSESSLREIVYNSKKVLLIDNLENDRRTKHLSKQGITNGSLICIPLNSHSVPIGFLYAIKDQEYGFDKDDVEVLTTFADNVTIAIENSRLITRSLERERFQQEIMIAQKMQRELLPQVLPEFPQFELAAECKMSMEVGGDYYDFAVLDDNSLSLVIADVSGKGISAAFYMAEAKGIFQSLTRLGLSPKKFALRANRTAFESLNRTTFISLIYSVVDTSKNKVRLIRAGHCPVVFVSNGKAELIRPSGMGLGLTIEPIFEEVTEEVELSLKNGDVCLYFTDGITESRNKFGEEFGYERLLESAELHRRETANGIKTGILEDVRRFTQGVEFGDDVTMIVLKWKGKES